MNLNVPKKYELRTTDIITFLFKNITNFSLLIESMVNRLDI